MYVCVYVSVHVEVRGQLVGVGSLLYYVCSEDRTQFVNLGSKHSYTLSPIFSN